MVRTWSRLALIGGFLAAGCANDDPDPHLPDPVDPSAIATPAAWAGTWRLSFTPVSDSTGGRFPREAGTDEVPALRSDPFRVVRVLCAGDTLAVMFSQLFFVGLPFGPIGEGTWSETNADWRCTLSLVDVDCTVPATVTFEATRTEQRMSGLLHVVATICEKPGRDLVDVSFTVDGERLSSIEVGCGALESSIPSDWQGSWSLTRSEVDCATGEVLSEGSTETHVLCAGASAHAYFRGGVSPFLIQGLGGGFDPTAFRGFVAYEDIAGGCLELTIVDIRGERIGDEMSRVEIVTTYTYDGPTFACESPPRCRKFELNGTRIENDPVGCDPPAEIDATP
jgi:hypothetical protein